MKPWFVPLLALVLTSCLAAPQQSTSCSGDAQCGDAEACVDGLCSSPCWRSCPADVGCQVRAHKATCIYGGGGRF